MSGTVVAPGPEAALVVRGLTIAGSGVRDFDLVVHAGESVALLGPDQEELTKIIRVVAGLDEAEAGEVRLLGVDVVAATRQELLQLRREVGYVSVAGGLLSSMTIRANIELPMRYQGRYSESEVRKRATDLIADLALTSCADRPASVVSAELQKCAAYARALACSPRVLLLEDPAAFLHPEGRVAVERVHARLRETGTTVLLADDDVELARRIADRAVWHEGGTITFDGPIGSLPEELDQPSVSEHP